ncbi:hypothetical protein [Hydrogenimonas sp.]
MSWLKRVLAGLALLLLFLAAAPLALSKERLCNAALEALKREKITLCYDERRTSPLGCEQKFTTILYGHSPVAKVKALRAYPTKVEAEGIRLEGLAAGFLPPRISLVRFDPLTGHLYAKGDFGELKGKVSWTQRRVALELLPSSVMKRKYRQAMRLFTFKDGKYRYETAF